MEPYYIAEYTQLPIKSLRFETLPSTQTWCIENIQRLIKDYNLAPYRWISVSAEKQSKAIGQRRICNGISTIQPWNDCFGSLKTSYVMPWPKNKVSLLPLFSIIASYATSKTIETFGLQCKIKWINDVLVKNKKIAGVIATDTGIDMIHGNDLYTAVVIGIGINVLETPDISYLTPSLQPTSIVEEQKDIIIKDLETLPLPYIARVENILTHEIYNAFKEFELRGFLFFHKYLNEHLHQRGEEVTVLADVSKTDNKNEVVQILVRGILLGLSSSDGALQIKTHEPEEKINNIYHGRLVSS